MPSELRNEENTSLYDQAFLPVSTTTGTPYPCSQKDIDILIHGRTRIQGEIPLLKNFIKHEETTAKLERFLHSSSLSLPDENKQAVDRLKRMVGLGIPTV